MHPLPSLPPGLVAVVGDERTGKTTLLRRLAGEATAAPDGIWLDLALPGDDQRLPADVWAAVQANHAAWNTTLHQDLVDALGLTPHAHKPLYMHSTGSRRKVALAGLLAAGARVTCLDQPFGALDAASARVLREFLADMADHATRTWVVADYTADARLPWRQVIELG